MKICKVKDWTAKKDIEMFIYCISKGVPRQAVSISATLSAVVRDSEAVSLQSERPPGEFTSEVAFALEPHWYRVACDCGEVASIEIRPIRLNDPYQGKTL